MEVSLMIEGQFGLTWERWQRIAAAVEELGFAGLYRSDHFTEPEPPNHESLEMVVSLAYLATNTSRIRFGALVSPVSFRDPVMLTRQVAAVDALSGGRALLGLGAGWQAREHQMFGYELGSTSTRLDRLEEGLEVATRLLRSAEPASYQGQFYQLREAYISPRPEPATQVVVGGNGPKRTLPLAARFADVWNGVFLSPKDFHERSTQLDQLLHDQGRPPESLKRTLMNGLHFGRDADELDRRLAWRHDDADLAGKSLEQAVAAIRVQSPMIVGNADEVTEQLRAYADAGVEELMVQWLDLDDIDGLRAFGEQVLPRL